MDESIFAIIFVSLIVIVLSLVIWLGYDAGYENGQIDYANNEIYYELQKQGDNTSGWKYCAEGCDK